MLFLTRHPRVFNILHRCGLVAAQTQTAPAELESLAHHARGAATAVEIGSFMGISAGRITSVMRPDGKLYCVDPCFAGGAINAVCVRHLQRLGLIRRIVMISKTGREALQALPRKVDFMFVDGDHSWEGIKTDWEIVKECLSIGGSVCFHDTSPPPERPHDRCDSVRFFEEVILRDHAFKHLETCATLNVLQRLTANG